MSVARRLHPGTIALRALARGPSTLLGLPAMFAVMSRESIALGLLIVAGLSVVAIVIGWLRWQAFTYRIGDDEVVIADGIVNKSRRSIPFERIQDVSIERKPLARIFGLAIVRIETGGGEKDEATLDSVSIAEAQRLRVVLRDRSVVEAGADTGAVTAPVPVFAMPLQQVLTMGAFRFSLVWIGVIFAAVNTAGEVVDIDLDDLREWIGIARAEARVLLTPIVLVAGVMAAVTTGVMAGIVRTVLVEYGFLLEHDGDRLRRRRGLLTRTEVVVALRRVQLALIERGAISGRMGRAGLRFQTLGGSDDVGGRQSVAPFARVDEIDRLLEISGFPRFDPLPLRPVAFGHILRTAALQGMAPAVVILGAAVFLPLALVSLALLPIPIATASLARRHHRYAIVGNTLQVMRGVLSQRTWIVPLDKVQAVSVVRTPLQRLLGIATVRVGTAGATDSARPDVVDLAVEDAYALADALSRRR